MLDSASLQPSENPHLHGEMTQGCLSFRISSPTDHHLQVDPIVMAMIANCSNAASDAAFYGDSLGCSIDTGGFSLFVTSATPTPSQISKICASAKCMNTIAAMKKAQPTECMYTFGLSLYKEIINPIEAVCPSKPVGGACADGTTAPITTAPPVPPPSPSTRCSSAVSAVVFGLDSIGCSNGNGGFSFFVISKVPTADQLPKICSSAKCLDIVAAIKKVQPTECLVPFGFSLYKEILSPIDNVCASKPIAPAPAVNATSSRALSAVVAAPPGLEISASSSVPGSGTELAPAVAIVGVVALVVVVSFFAFRATKERKRRHEENTAGTPSKEVPILADA